MCDTINGGNERSNDVTSYLNTVGNAACNNVTCISNNSIGWDSYLLPIFLANNDTSARSVPF